MRHLFKRGLLLLRQNKKGKTAAQIREGIKKGEWKQVNLETAASIN